MTTLRPGTAPIKAEFLLSNTVIAVPDDDAAEGGTSHASGNRDNAVEREDSRSGPQRRKPTREEKKSRKGQNKGRRFQKVRDELELCWKIASGKDCEFGADCRNTHDIEAYLAAKTRDIYFPSFDNLTEEPPFVTLPSEDAVMVDQSSPSMDPSTTCPVHAVRGECRMGLKCRFLGAHARKTDAGDWEVTVDEEKKARSAVLEAELNFIGGETLKKLRTKKYPCPISDAYLKELQVEGDASKVKETNAPAEVTVSSEPQPTTDVPDEPTVSASHPSASVANEPEAQVDTPDVQMRPAEKKRLHWKGKTYLAPLTTVGNLPFRRLCVDYGADITCGEMALANSFLQGSKEEWSLVRRHPSEKIFGVQVAGSKPSLLVPTAEILAKELGGNLDFVDINCGCPIDLVFKTGSGSALLDSAGKLGKIVVGMNKALGDIPVTLKLRTGVKDGRNNAHKLMPRLGHEWNAAALTLHGRTRQQRYTRLADWDYIKTCVDAVREREAEEDLHPIPIFGGGDVFSSEDYWEKVDSSGVDGIMIGRGALIKPWVFTEVKERREWDISARERLELVRKFADYGLNHFGSDTPGVNTTRRYLCEALSFQYRYIPLGLLETLPGRINDRAPSFRGRNELETLLGSPNSQDWVKISEMFLGPAPEGWSFTPKHKSNAYGQEESQG
ncbi:tRNA-dihydrouridine synthase 3 [Steccherinum ochraceum]|uniref:tRNA-dihydrouridine(47) synthase [NAD(P)(+)] n=1 Tax=Steccherinum ochraceum TaxID=92696 RepID=A0A4R0RMV2_9APHY|nr:tRNA-dihydrouridine synthase 3 [Steccherinum ochraceum]